MHHTFFQAHMTCCFDEGKGLRSCAGKDSILKTRVCLAKKKGARLPPEVGKVEEGNGGS